MKDICKLLGIKKLNTTASHPQCNGAVEKFNGTLKSMLKKQTTKVGAQWNQYLSGVLRHIVICPTVPQEKNNHFCSLALIVILQQNLSCYQLNHLE